MHGFAFCSEYYYRMLPNREYKLIDIRSREMIHKLHKSIQIYTH